jgi:hypothetical protein
MPFCSLYVILTTNLVTDLLHFEDKELHGAEDQHLSDYRQPLDSTASLE